MADDEQSTPSFDLPAPMESYAGAAMRQRIAARLELVDEVPIQQISRFEVLRRVGSGGMGVVYAARDPQLDRTVALKLVRGHAISDDGRARLIGEAQNLAKLSHPNVVAVYEIGEHEGDVYIAMEFVEGETLARWRAREGLTLDERLRVLRAAGDGLSAAHAAGIVHRDFKPSNVLVGSDGRVRVVDFGLARPTGNDSEGETDAIELRPRSGSTSVRVAGTPGYIAPELYEGRSADFLSDQFAFCVTAWDVLTGARPRVDARLRPEWVRRVLARGLSERPEERWPSVAQLVTALNRRHRRQRRAGLALVGVGVGVGLALGPALQSEPALCPDPSSAFDQVWTVSRHAQLRLALARFDQSWIGGVDERLVAELERQRERWIATRSEVCRATKVERSRSVASFDRANICLDRHLHRVDNLLQIVANPSPEQLAGLDRQLDALGDPRDCAVPTRPLPPAEIAREVDALTRRLDRIELAFAAGVEPDAPSKLRALVDEAKQLGFAALETDALALQARVAFAHHDYELAASAGLAANLAAERSGDDRQLFEVRRQLVATHAYLGEQSEPAGFWYDQCRATFERLDRPAPLEPGLLDAESELARARGELARAERALRDALELSRSVDSGLASSRLSLSLANVLADLGQHDAARELYLGHRDRQREAQGAEHPEVGVAEFDLCVLELDRQDPVAARPHCEQARAIQVASFGAESPRLLPIDMATAKLALYEGELEFALAQAELLWTEQARAFPPTHTNHRAGLELLADVRLFAGQLEPALVAAEQLAALPDARRDPGRALLEQNLGWLRCRLRSCAGAQENFETVLELVDDPSLRIYAQLGLANVALEAGDPGRALELLDAMVVTEFELANPEFEAERSWLHAWARHELGATRSEIAEFVDRASELYEQVGPRRDIQAKLEQLRMK